MGTESTVRESFIFRQQEVRFLRVAVVVVLISNFYRAAATAARRSTDKGKQKNENITLITRSFKQVSTDYFESVHKPSLSNERLVNTILGTVDYRYNYRL